MDSLVHENTERTGHEAAFLSVTSEGTRLIHDSVVESNQERLARKNLEPGMRTDVCINPISSIIKASGEHQHGAGLSPQSIDNPSQESIVRSSQDHLIRSSPECSELQKPSEQTIVPSNQDSWLPASVFRSGSRLLMP